AGGVCEVRDVAGAGNGCGDGRPWRGAVCKTALEGDAKSACPKRSSAMQKHQHWYYTISLTGHAHTYQVWVIDFNHACSNAP
ncbi:hypothetical protein KKF82_07140, partial [Patescibacteria group bacterium]|nr:hypothetical protein [Patescibacteria group bacterium]